MSGIRIGILTYHYVENYGAVLQTYALQKVVSELCNAEVVILNYRPLKTTKMITLKKRIRYLLRRFYHFKSFLVKKRFTHDLNKRARIFEKFQNQYLNLSGEPITTIKDLKDVAQSFDIIICGSDQVWNPNISTWSEAYLLAFIQNVKKVAYAASLGLNNIPEEYVEMFKNAITRFDAVSVRERTGANMILTLLNNTVPVVLDPTLLISADEFSSNIMPYNQKDKKYILVFVFNKTKKITEFVDMLIKKTGLHCIALPSNFKDYAKEALFELDPFGFISMIKNAAYVITDSFHCTIFSINLNVQFFTFGDGLDTLKSKSSRLIDILSLFELRDRFDVSSESLSLTPIDFSKTNLILTEQREHSLRFIREALINDSNKT